MIKTNTIHLGDAIEVMQTLPSESVDLVVTSPPYNIRNSSGNGMKAKASGHWKGSKLNDGYADDYDDAMPHDLYVEWQRNCIAEMMRLLKDDGAIFYNHKWRVQNGLLQDRHDIVASFPVRQIIIWDRCGGLNFNSGYFLPTFEVIYLIAKPDFKLAPKAAGWGDVWRFPPEGSNPHPAPFPLELPERCIRATGAQIVLDPFMGSGTTALAARKLGREYIGIERAEQYRNMALERLAQPYIVPMNGL